MALLSPLYRLLNAVSEASGDPGIGDGELVHLTGCMWPYAGYDGGASDPPGLLFVRPARTVSRTTYARLFGIIGTRFGVGDGSTTFHLPPPGYFWRAWEGIGAATVDPDAAARVAIVAGTWTLAGCVTVSGSPSVSVTELSNIAEGMTITGTGIPASTVVRAKSAASGAGTVTLGNAANSANVNATANGTVTLTFGNGASGNYPGSLELDAGQGHRHAPLAAQFSQSAPAAGGTPTMSNTTGQTANNFIGDPQTDGANGTPRTSSETRPKNVTVPWVIKT